MARPKKADKIILMSVEGDLARERSIRSGVDIVDLLENKKLHLLNLVPSGMFIDKDGLWIPVDLENEPQYQRDSFEVKRRRINVDGSEIQYYQMQPTQPLIHQ